MSLPAGLSPISSPSGNMRRRRVSSSSAPPCVYSPSQRALPPVHLLHRTDGACGGIFYPQTSARRPHPCAKGACGPSPAFFSRPGPLAGLGFELVR
jgi:hypothetical protein